MIFLIIGSIVILCISIFLFLQTSKKKINLEQQQKRKKQLEQSIDALHFQLDDQGKDYQVLCKLLDEKKKENEDIQKKIDFSNKILQEKEQNYTSLLTKVDNLKDEYNKYYHQQKQIVEEQLEEFKKISSKAAQNYFNGLEKVYQSADAAHVQKMTRLKEEQDKAAADLNTLKETRKAAYEAVLKEKEIKQNKKFYTVQLDKKYEHDIYLLNSISSQLIQSRPVNMVIWTSYYSKKVNELCARIIGTDDKSGIYKITYLPTNQCYIGQAKNLKERIRTHIKTGTCHIDTPCNNKLYEIMGQNPIEDFTFEILDFCSIEQLNQKERYFINFYQSYDYGFNGNRGVSK